MAKYRMVRTDFWKNPIVSEEMTPEDKYFYLYLLTNPATTQIGIYKITKKQIAFDMGYSIESVHSLVERFIQHHKMIQYNIETRELAIKNWGKYNLQKGGKPVMDCIESELKEVEDSNLIQYVSETIEKEEIRDLFDSFCKQSKLNEGIALAEADTYFETTSKNLDDTYSTRETIRGQKEKQKENKKEKQQQEAVDPKIEIHPDRVSNHIAKDVKEIIEFWDNNGFGFSNMNAKEQLLAWLDDSNFLQPKAVVLKALNIACANNKRRLSYVAGILKNWENESLLTIEEIDSYLETPKTVSKQKQSTESSHTGRAIPGKFVLDLTGDEDLCVYRKKRS